MKKSRVKSLALVLLVLAASCSKDPITGPSVGPGGTTTPTPSTTNVVLDGPLSVAPGATAQFTLTAQLADGTTKDVTRDAIWSIFSTGRATVVAGLVTGLSAGDAFMSVRYNPPGQPAIFRSREVIVLPDGTFRVLGRVLENGFGIPVPSARVAVLSGNTVGQVSMASGDGRYRLYGVVGPAGIEAKKSGYRDDFRQVVITAHDQSVDFALIAGSAPQAVEGSYTLTIAASASCREALPEEVRVRTYDAELTRSSGRLLSVRLSSPTTVSSFSGRLDPVDLVTFAVSFDYYGYQYPLLIERVGTNQLYINGQVSTTLSADRISGNMSGLIDLRTGPGARIGACSASDHLFDLRRR